MQHTGIRNDAARAVYGGCGISGQHAVLRIQRAVVQDGAAGIRNAIAYDYLVQQQLTKRYLQYAKGWSSCGAAALDRRTVANYCDWAGDGGQSIHTFGCLRQRIRLF